jgi:glycosyltransferase involved in cell wall biosynthesis
LSEKKVADCMEKITVLFVPYVCDLLGSERSLFTLVSALQSSAHIRPVVLLPREGPLTALIRDAGIHVMVHRYSAWIGKGKRISGAVKRSIVNVIALIQVYRKIGSLKPDIIYTNTLATPFGAMISLLFGIPHIWHAREFVHEDLQWYYDIGTGLSMALVKRSDKIICNSRAVKEKLEKAINRDIFQVVYNGFRFDEKDTCFDGTMYDKYENCVSRDGVITLLMIGSIHPGKGQEDAVRALSVLLSRGYDVQLSIAGSGENEYISFLKSLSKQLEVEDRIRWHGFLDDLTPLLAEAALLLICSRSEAFGRVAVEALSAGTPVVGTRSGGLPEIIEDNVTGLLYQPGNHQEMAGQIERLLINRELYLDIMRRGRQSVIARFTVDQYVSGVERIIEEVSNKRQN